MKTLQTTLILALLCIASINANAQNLKFGKPTQQEWDMVAWGEAPDAEAIVLCKTLKVNYALSGTFKAYDSSTPFNAESIPHIGVNQYLSEGATTLTYDVMMRTKILKDSGAGYANIDIVYFSDEKNLDMYDELQSFNVVAYNMVNGKVKKQRLDKSNYTDERLDANYMVRHVRVPDAKAGTIIEYKYQLFSKRAAFLHDWQIQEDIPVLYTKCEMDIPVFLQFNMQVPIHPMVTKNVTKGMINLPQEISDLQAPKRCESNCYKIESHDILPLALDLQRSKPDTPATDKNKAMNIHSVITSSNVPRQIPLPAGKRHIMMNP